MELVYKPLSTINIFSVQFGVDCLSRFLDPTTHHSPPPAAQFPASRMLPRHEPAFLIWCTEIRMKWTSTSQNPHQARKKQEQVVKKEQLLNWDACTSAG